MLPTRFVAGWKRDVVCRALTAQGCVAETVGHEVLTSPPRSRRRATLAARKTKGGALVAFTRADRILIVPNTRMPLAASGSSGRCAAIEAMAHLGGSRSQEISVTITKSLTGPDVQVTLGKPLDAALRMELARLAERFVLARLTCATRRWRCGPCPSNGFGAARVQMPPAAFLQATAEGEAALVAAAVSQSIGRTARG